MASTREFVFLTSVYLKSNNISLDHLGNELSLFELYIFLSSCVSLFWNSCPSRHLTAIYMRHTVFSWNFVNFRKTFKQKYRNRCHPSSFWRVFVWAKMFSRNTNTMLYCIQYTTHTPREQKTRKYLCDNIWCIQVYNYILYRIIIKYREREKGTHTHWKPNGG